MSLNILISSAPIYKFYNAIIPQPKRTKAEEKKNKDKKETLSMALSQIALGLLFFVVVRRLWWHAVLVPNGWEWNGTKGGVSREVLGGLVAIVHSTSLLLPLLGCLLSHPTGVPSESFSTSPPVWNHAARTMISFTTAYMTQDALGILYYSYDWSRGVLDVSPDNKLFVAHHLVCIIYMCVTRYLNAGHYSSMQLMFLGEVTNPTQNAYTIMQLASRFHPGPTVSFFRPFLAPVFAGSYLVVRFVVGPIITLLLTKDFIFSSNGRKNVPVPLGVIFCLMCVGIIVGSVNFGKTTARDALTDKWPTGELRDCGDKGWTLTNYDSYDFC